MVLVPHRLAPVHVLSACRTAGVDRHPRHDALFAEHVHAVRQQDGLAATVVVVVPRAQAYSTPFRLVDRAGVVRHDGDENVFDPLRWHRSPVYKNPTDECPAADKEQPFAAARLLALGEHSEGVAPWQHHRHAAHRAHHLVRHSRRRGGGVIHAFEFFGAAARALIIAIPKDYYYFVGSLARLPTKS